jgi:hypothetical protein
MMKKIPIGRNIPIGIPIGLENGYRNSYRKWKFLYEFL